MNPTALFFGRKIQSKNNSIKPLLQPKYKLDEYDEFLFKDIGDLINPDGCKIENQKFVCKIAGVQSGFVMSLPEKYANKKLIVEISGLISNTELTIASIDEDRQQLFQKSIDPIKNVNRHIIVLESNKSSNRLLISFKNPIIDDCFSFESIKFYIDHSKSKNTYEPRIVAGVATIPERDEQLQNALMSLINQVDLICIYLNNFDFVPQWIQEHPKLKYFLSDEFDNRGDAGKFYAYDKEEFDYFISFDDDIQYPNNYVSQLVKISNEVNAPVGVHGSVLKYPFMGYYARESRYVYHFKDKNLVNRRVHIIGTGTLCIPKRIISKLPHFNYPNMADIWLSKYCSDIEIPLIAIKRKIGWLEPLGSHENSIFYKNIGTESIQKKILETELSRFSSKVTTLKSIYPKVLIGITASNHLHQLKKLVESLIASIEEEPFEIVIAIAEDQSSEEVHAYLQKLRIPFELHILASNSESEAVKLNALLDVAQKINFDFLVMSSDIICFKQKGWLTKYYQNARLSGYHHLSFYNHSTSSKSDSNESSPAREPSLHLEHSLAAYGGVKNSSHLLFTLTPQAFRKVGFLDTDAFASYPSIVDFSNRCCKVGFNEAQRFFDIADSSQFIEVQAHDGAEQFLNQRSGDIDHNAPIQSEKSSIYIQNPTKHLEDVSGPNNRKTASKGLAGLFDLIILMDSGGHGEAKPQTRAALEQMNIAYLNSSASPEQISLVNESYNAYLESDAKINYHKILSAKEFFIDDISDAKRAIFIKTITKAPPIPTLASWNDLVTYEKVLIDCLNSQHDYFLILEEGCLFHKNFAALLDKAAKQLPVNWKLLQLGAMQSDWDLTRPYSENLYMPNGVISNAFAFGFHRDVIPVFLKYLSYRSMPFGLGALHYAGRVFNELSFAVQPNLVVNPSYPNFDLNHHLNRASDSEQNKESLFKWNLEDYEKLN
ncbi:hypothetical protein ICN48_10885 [Polynucleobacter sp. JS-Safj-400b-B2]|uniref:glycosyltransferase family 2 protein n=1 Tax=Polynucleobacter sp. JS-Safj-400b-B2 TaxID=2576921 RepID=UPI001C0D7340|nr:hypothetical protein [Polynucleobacter sp. JS-Safj-400b-B2]MBU3626736.1 hypothetical protein [Polynucleobacter sp. JS-Safj-400b-B2]